MSRHLLLVALLLLAALLAWGFRGQPLVAAFAALPPALIAAALAMGLRSAGFWAGVFALGWFSYGVMEAWTLHGTARLYALGILALSLVIVIASSWAGLKARFGRNTPD
ncbi:DUF2069 domain-containing protein [Luteimonas sp. e5]